MFPFIFKESLESLKSLSFLGVTAIFTFLACIIIRLVSAMTDEQYRNSVRYTDNIFLPDGDYTDILGSLPTVLLAFTFQFNVFPVFFTLKERTNAGMIKGTAGGVGFCFSIYILTGIIGFVIYGVRIKSSILDVFGDDGSEQRLAGNYFNVVILTIINIAFMVSATMSIPLMFFSLKKNLLNTIIFCKKKCGNKRVSPQFAEKLNEIVNSDSDSGKSAVSKPCSHPIKVQVLSDRVRNIITVVTFCLVCLLTILIKQLDAVKLQLKV